MKNSFKLTRIALIFLLMFLVGCLPNKEAIIGDVISDDVLVVEKIEVYHFHSNRQCSTCKTIGDNLDETIERYFLDEVNSGKIIYGHINIQDLKNSEITKRYGASGTSLWIGVYDKKGFHPEADKGIWYKLNDKEAFIDYLKNIIEKRLSGDMN